MPIQKCKPTSPGRRFVEKVVHDHLHKGAPYAPLVEAKKRTGGRNNNGHITQRIKQFVGFDQIIRLADDRNANVFDLLDEVGLATLDLEAVNAFEFINRASSMPQATTAHLSNRNAETCNEWR